MMTTAQVQHLLAYLGFDPGPCDGLEGPRTQKAVSAFQAAFGLEATGQADEATREALRHGVGFGMPEGKEPETGDFWDNIQYFTREEFRCQCGGRYCNGFPVEPQENMVRTVDEIRRRLGVPVEVVSRGGSGVRCPRHNAAVGGAANSNHLYGKAADLHAQKSPREMAQIAEEVMGSRGEIGIYSWGIHVAVDCRYSRFYGQ